MKPLIGKPCTYLHEPLTATYTISYGIDYKLNIIEIYAQWNKEEIKFFSSIKNTNFKHWFWILIVRILNSVPNFSDWFWTEMKLSDFFSFVPLCNTWCPRSIVVPCNGGSKQKIQIEKCPKIVQSGAYFGYYRALQLHAGEQIVASVRATLKAIYLTAVTSPCFERKKKD